jgi:hypothetical protein
MPTAFFIPATDDAQGFFLSPFPESILRLGDLMQEVTELLIESAVTHQAALRWRSM